MNLVLAAFCSSTYERVSEMPRRHSRRENGTGIGGVALPQQLSFFSVIRRRRLMVLSINYQASNLK